MRLTVQVIEPDGSTSQSLVMPLDNAEISGHIRQS
jgi:hypothetical protein